MPILNNPPAYYPVKTEVAMITVVCQLAIIAISGLNRTQVSQITEKPDKNFPISHRQFQNSFARFLCHSDYVLHIKVIKK